MQVASRGPANLYPRKWCRNWIKAAWGLFGVRGRGVVRMEEREALQCSQYGKYTAVRQDDGSDLAHQQLPPPLRSSGSIVAGLVLSDEKWVWYFAIGTMRSGGLAQ